MSCMRCGGNRGRAKKTPRTSRGVLFYEGHCLRIGMNCQAINITRQSTNPAEASTYQGTTSLLPSPAGSFVSGHEFTRAAPSPKIRSGFSPSRPVKRKSCTPTRVMLSVCAKHPSARISPRDGRVPPPCGFWCMQGWVLGLASKNCIHGSASLGGEGFLFTLFTPSFEGSLEGLPPLRCRGGHRQVI